MIVCCLASSHADTLFLFFWVSLPMSSVLILIRVQPLHNVVVSIATVAKAADQFAAFQSVRLGWTSGRNAQHFLAMLVAGVDGRLTGIQTHNCAKAGRRLFAFVDRGGRLLRCLSRLVWLDGGRRSVLNFAALLEQILSNIFSQLLQLSFSIIVFTLMSLQFQLFDTHNVGRLSVLVRSGVGIVSCPRVERNQSINCDSSWMAKSIN